jgi:hypothetical protein
VAKNGAKQWVQRITIRGKRCELGLGSPPAVPLSEARKLALENRGKAMLGGDPLAEKRAAKSKPLTFAECVKYLCRGETGRVSEREAPQAMAFGA